MVGKGFRKVCLAQVSTAAIVTVAVINTIMTQDVRTYPSNIAGLGSFLIHIFSYFIVVEIVYSNVRPSLFVFRTNHSLSFVGHDSASMGESLSPIVHEKCRTSSNLSFFKFIEYLEGHKHLSRNQMLQLVSSDTRRENTIPDVSVASSKATYPLFGWYYGTEYGSKLDGNML